MPLHLLPSFTLAGNFLYSVEIPASKIMATCFRSIPPSINLGLGGGLSGVVGATRNAAMSIATASATATFTADEIIVETALGGTQYRLSSFNKTINLGVVGAGGIDVAVSAGVRYLGKVRISHQTQKNAYVSD